MPRSRRSPRHGAQRGPSLPSTIMHTLKLLDKSSPVVCKGVSVGVDV